MRLPAVVHRDAVLGTLLLLVGFVYTDTTGVYEGGEKGKLSTRNLASIRNFLRGEATLGHLIVSFHAPQLWPRRRRAYRCFAGFFQARERAVSAAVRVLVAQCGPVIH